MRGGGSGEGSSRTSKVYLFSKEALTAMQTPSHMAVVTRGALSCTFIHRLRLELYGGLYERSSISPHTHTHTHTTHTPHTHHTHMRAHILTPSTAPRMSPLSPMCARTCVCVQDYHRLSRRAWLSLRLCDFGY